MQAMLEAAEKVAGASPRIAVFDRKRKIELALKLQQRWQRWELTNFDYLMQVCPATQPSLHSPHRHFKYVIIAFASFFNLNEAKSPLHSLQCHCKWCALCTT